MKVKTVAKYILLLVVAILLGWLYSIIIHTGFNFDGLINGTADPFEFLRWTFSVQTVVTFVVLFFYMVFFIKFLIRLFK